jgi:hypothetical protein
MTHVAVLLALPAALTVLLPDWFYTYHDTIDPWVYHGFFRHYESYTTTLFPGTYYGTRLGWIAPGYLAYAAFGAVTANAVLHVAFYIAALFALYRIVLTVVGASAALFAAVAFGLHLPVIRAIGADYVDGPVTTYALIAAACVTRAWRTSSPWPSLLGGIAVGAMLHSNIGAALLLPSILIWLVPASRETADWKRAAWHVWNLLTGLLAGTALLAQFSLAHGGSWLFFIPSLSYATQTSNPWDVAGVNWMLSAPWLFLPAALAAAAMLVYATRGRQLWADQLQTRAVAAFALTLLIFVVFDYAGPGALLAAPFYASWLLPSAFVMIGVLVHDDSSRPWPRHALAFVPLVLLGASVARPSWFALPWQAAAPIAAIALILTGAVARSRLIPTLTIACALACVQGAMPATYHADPTRVDAFHAIDKGVSIIERYRTSRPAFLLDVEGPLARYSRGLTSVYLWGYTIVGPEFPRITEQQAALVEPGMTVVIISNRQSTGSRFDEVFEPYGMAGAVLGRARIDTSRGALYLTVLRAMSAPETELVAAGT